MVKIHCAENTSEIESWVNNLHGALYDTLKIRCDSVDNSTSGVIFTATIQMKPTNGE